MSGAPEIAVTERDDEIAGVPVHLREAPYPDADRPPVLYLHGNPSDGGDFLPFLVRGGGIAPDLPGFGRSGKSSTFDYSIEGYADFLEALVDHLELERFSLVVHDWGGVGLALAQRRPESVERLVLVNCVPLLPGYRWHRWARLWRRRVVGELAMGLTNRSSLKLTMREAFVTRGAAFEELVDRAWSHFDHGTQRAVLRLYRSASEDALAAAGSRLGDIAAPALVAWGERDPYLSTDFALAYGEALGGEARVELVPGAGHWPWLDRPELVDQIVAFLGEGS